MTEHPSLEALAQSLFDQAWTAAVQRGRRHRPAFRPGGGVTGCEVRWLLPELVRLVAESHDQPVDALEPTIRRMIREQDFVDESGDPVFEPDHDEAIDLCTQVFVHVLEQVRQQALETGRWSRVPVTPPMFG